MVLKKCRFIHDMSLFDGMNNLYANISYKTARKCLQNTFRFQIQCILRLTSMLFALLLNQQYLLSLNDRSGFENVKLLIVFLQLGSNK